MSFAAFLNSLVLPATSSLTAIYRLVIPSNLTPVAKFTARSFWHLAWTCSTPVFYRRTVQSNLTGSSAAHKTLTFSTRTDNIACWVIRWSLSLCSVRCSLWSLSLEVFQAPYGHCHLKFSVLLMVAVNLKCSVLLIKRQIFLRHSLICTGTSADLSKFICYVMYRCQQFGAMLLIYWWSCPKCQTVNILISYLQTSV